MANNSKTLLIVGGVAVLVIGGIIAYSYFKKDSPPVEPPDGGGNKDFYYQDLYKRGGLWLRAAQEYSTLTSGITNTDQIYAIYLQVFEAYQGLPNNAPFIMRQLRSIEGKYNQAWVNNLVFDPADVSGSTLVEIMLGSYVEIFATQACTISYINYTKQLVSGWNIITWA
jgi:hypothetical protein